MEGGGEKKGSIHILSSKGYGEIFSTWKENFLGVKDVRSIIAVLKESIHVRYACLCV